MTKLVQIFRKPENAAVLFKMYYWQDMKTDFNWRILSNKHTLGNFYLACINCLRHGVLQKCYSTLNSKRRPSGWIHKKSSLFRNSEISHSVCQFPVLYCRAPLLCKLFHQLSAMCSLAVLLRVRSLRGWTTTRLSLSDFTGPEKEPL